MLIHSYLKSLDYSENFKNNSSIKVITKNIKRGYFTHLARGMKTFRQIVLKILLYFQDISRCKTKFALKVC